MRAKEFIFEAGIAYNAGKIAAQKDQFASGYQKGKGMMNKIMSPSKWFQKSEKPVETKGYRTRQSLEQASRGAQMYRSDTEVLTDLYRKLKSGAVTTNLPLDQVMLAVKSAANGIALNDEQKALLGQLSKQF
jgi:hypothetical protein